MCKGLYVSSDFFCPSKPPMDLVVVYVWKAEQPGFLETGTRVGRGGWLYAMYMLKMCCCY
jgi:hypothetical protein